MLKLKNRMIEPKGGWVYRDPDLNVRLRASCFNNLVQAVRSLRAVNHRPIPDDIAEVIEHAVCLGTHKDFVANPEDDFLGMITIIDMVNAMHKFKPGSIPKTNQKEAERRGNICASCQHNCPTVCLSCTGHDAVLRSNYGLDQMEHDRVLHVCQMDGTSIMAVVQMELGSVQKHAIPKQLYPEHCWKRGQS